MAAHSDAALRRLQTLVVSGLKDLPYDLNLEEQEAMWSISHGEPAPDRISQQFVGLYHRLWRRSI